VGAFCGGLGLESEGEEEEEGDGCCLSRIHHLS
jgi:hypothetical protein